VSFWVLTDTCHKASIKSRTKSSPSRRAALPQQAQGGSHSKFVSTRALTCTHSHAPQVFQYMPALCVVTAHAAPPADNNLLRAMFPGDDGSALPSLVASEAVAHQQGPPFKFSASRVARPYRYSWNSSQHYHRHYYCATSATQVA
jgi:hypothetical protein